MPSSETPRSACATWSSATDGERARHESFFRWLLPLAASREQPTRRRSSRPRAAPRSTTSTCSAPTVARAGRAAARRARLATRCSPPRPPASTPARGDEIIQIGATRIVAGKLRRDVRPAGRPAAHDSRGGGIPIHGITPRWWPGAHHRRRARLPRLRAGDRAGGAQRGLRHALPELQQATGIVFDQPVLDTLLLGGGAPAAGIAPAGGDRRALVNVLGRHTAVGDAMVTAEIFPEAHPAAGRARHPHAGQAREAAQQTYARVSY